MLGLLFRCDEFWVGWAFSSVDCVSLFACKDLFLDAVV